MKVAVAVILDDKNRILITQRPLHAPHGGFWEFPGGKLEQNESAEAALVREIREEVGLEIIQYQFLGDIHHQYPNRAVNLFVFLVTEFSGIPCCLEGQLNMQWVKRQNLITADFPEANHRILELLEVFFNKTA
ncbi:MAG: 8-oxo-dGTP diphosphatase MutT [Legionellales bacterium]